MKNIVFITPDMDIGGVQQSLLTLLRAFPTNTVSLTVLLFSVSGDLLALIPPHVKVVEAKAPGWIEKLRIRVSAALQRAGTERIFMFAKSVYHLIGSKIIGKQKAAHNYDIAIAYNDGLATWYTAWRINAQRKMAFVHTDFRAADYKAESEREIYRRFDTICFSCESSRKSFLELLPEYESKTAIVPNMVDRQRIRSLAQEPDRLPSKDDLVSLLTVGRVSREKGVVKIPELLRYLKEDGLSVCWYIIGDGPECENLRNLARKYDVADNLVLIGRKVNPYPFMASCDIYIQPSDYEGYCIALAEARALCRPIIACDFNGAREQISDGVTGFITGLATAEILPKLEYLIKSRELRSNFSAALRTEDTGSSNEAVQRWIESIIQYQRK